MERNSLSFTDMEIIKNIEGIDCFLLKLEKLVDWSKFTPLLSSVDRRRSKHTGRDCYSPETIFRIFIITTYYNLTDREVEFHLRTNVLFSYFCKISFGNPVPDHSTLSRWRDRFSVGGLYESLFNEFNNQLVCLGVEIKNAVITDATFVTSQARPRKKVVIDVEATSQADQLADSTACDNIKLEVTTEYSLDPDARWTTKGKEHYFGYKQTNSTNTAGFINAVVTTPANVADCKIFASVLEKVKPQAGTDGVADKAYESQYNSELLRQYQMNDKIMRKNKPHSDNAKNIERNKEISKIRFVAERTFGYCKLKLGQRKSRYIGLTKTHNCNVFTALVYNMVRSLKIPLQERFA